jgi:outer membrane receptor protein involved in Fe transport
MFAVLCSASHAAADDTKKNPATEIEAPTVEVISTTPLPGIGVPADQIPANVQAYTGKQIENQHTIDFSNFINQNLSSVNANSTVGNPFQNDVNFRGFTASPLIGTPQGLSVFMDGVRVNDPFGDTVDWDLIPQSAISSINLIPGSNPVFGLNTLGGALSINTKSGFEYPGFSAQALGGSWGRRQFEFEGGTHGKNADLFITGNLFQQDGWRDRSPSRVNQIFAKAGWQNETSDLDVSFAGTRNNLQGTQALPLSMLGNPAQAYTAPDIISNDLSFFNVRGSHFFNDTTLISANLYYRSLRQYGFNSNVNDDFDSGEPVSAGNAPASNVIGYANQVGSGGALQLTLLNDLGKFHNQLVLGASLDHGHTGFSQYTGAADFTASRDTDAILFGPAELTTKLLATNDYYGLYFTDTFAVNERTHLTLSGRWNRAQVKLEDQLGTALNGDHVFTHFNPAAGVTFRINRALTSYVSYNQGMRAPTPVELTCADPNAPCSLPNDFLGDPALDPVISKTWEGGLRGRLAQHLVWRASLFRTNLENDIQFVSAGGGALNAGYFQNIPETRRQGIELDLSGHVGHWTFGVGYTYLDATYQSSFVMNSPNNSSAAPISCPTCADIRVNPGDHIPGIPRHLLKTRVQYDFDPRFSVGANLYAASSQFARGDENNRDVNGPVPGYALVNLDASYRPAKHWEVFARVDNLFDRSYQTFGLLGENFFNGPGNTFDAGAVTAEQFRTPGAPRAMWVGVRYTFGAPSGGQNAD